MSNDSQIALGAAESAAASASAAATAAQEAADRLEEFQAGGGGGGSSSLTVVSGGTVDLDNTKPDGYLIGYKVTATTTIEGTSFAVGSYIFERDSSVYGGWTARTIATGTQVVPSPDSTPPTAGTLASSAITATGATVTVSGASDAVALHASPYAFSKDNGSTWTAYQSSNAYTWTGLTGSTGYQMRHRVRDAAGNVTTGTAITVTTSAPAVDWAAYDADVAASSPFHFLKLESNTTDTGSAAATFTPTNISYAAIGNTTGADFDGTSSSIARSTQGTVGSGTPAYTVEAVIIADSLSANRDIAGTGSASQQMLLSSAKVYGYIGATAAIGATTLVAGTRYHIAMVYNGTDIRVYVNGALDGTAAKTGNIGGVGVPWRIGGTAYFDGRMTRVAAYTTALSAATILSRAQRAGLA